MVFKCIGYNSGVNMLTIQNNYGNSDLKFGSKFRTRMLRNVFFTNYEKKAMDEFTKNMSADEKNYVIRSMAHILNVRPVNMFSNFISNLFFKLI